MYYNVIISTSCAICVATKSWTIVHELICLYQHRLIPLCLVISSYDDHMVTFAIMYYLTGAIINIYSAQ